MTEKNPVVTLPMLAFVAVSYIVLAAMLGLNLYLWRAHAADRALVKRAEVEAALNQEMLEVFGSVGTARMQVLACYQGRAPDVSICQLAAYVVQLAHDSYADSSKGLPWWATDQGFLMWRANTEQWKKDALSRGGGT